MKVKVRTHPIEVFYLTGEDAAQARRESHGSGDGPCFTTEAFGMDGFAWETCEEFESDYRLSFPHGGLGFEAKELTLERVLSFLRGAESLLKPVVDRHGQEWKPTVEMSGGWLWACGTGSVYATPFWDNEPGISVELWRGGADDYYATTFVPFKLSGDLQGDVDAYLAVLKLFLDVRPVR